MFKKVLIVEDHEMTSIAVRKAIEDFGIIETQHTYYCDDALKLIQKSELDGQPFDLLITDLVFEEDQRKQRISGDAELIALVKNRHPNVKIIVFSAENKQKLVDFLFKKLSIDGYVRKTKDDATDFNDALRAISIGEKFLTRKMREVKNSKSGFEFTSYDVVIIGLLSAGMLQKDIPKYLKVNGIAPSGLSSVEKRLNCVRQILGFSKNEQLVAYCKDFGII